MSREQINKPLFVVIYPYKFSDFYYDHIEIEYFKNYCQVAIWDISNIIDRKFAEGISVGRSSKKELVLVESIRQFISQLLNLRKIAKNSKVCVLNEVQFDNMSSFICNLMIQLLLKKTGAAILDTYIGGIPISAIGGSTGSRNIFRRCLSSARRINSLPEVLKKLQGVSYQVLRRIFNIYPTTHRLVAGDEWIKQAKRHGADKKGIRLIYGSSEDFSNNLLGNFKKITAHRGSQKTSVLLASAVPAFGGDNIYLRRRLSLTSDVWYPSLTKFLDKVEAETGVVVEIAGHYKSAHPPVAPCFGNRRVHYNMTKELTRACEFVITRASTAISYAVIFKKPIIFIYSNQLENDFSAMTDIRGMAAALGNTPINIDDLNIDICALLTVDENKYKAYEKACLTSVIPLRTNVQVILEDVMGIKVDPDSFRKGTANANLQ